MSCEKLEYLLGKRKCERFNLDKYKDNLIGSGLLEPDVGESRKSGSEGGKGEQSP
jgi:hypothetical protein